MSLDVHELASLAEARAVLHVNALAWRAAYDFLPESSLPDVDYEPDPARVNEFYANYRERTAPVFVACRDGEVRGFVELRWGPDEIEAFVPPADAELKALYVHPEDWGQGIGSRLVDAALFVVPPTYDRLVLQTFRENEAARAFYEAQDFQLVGSASFQIDGRTYPTVVYARELA